MKEPKESNTLAEQVYIAVRDQIQGGMLLPGAKVSLRSLAKTFGTSMQPVREAVTRLIVEDALEVTPARVIQVPQLVRAQSDELWSLRALMEGEAAALFTLRATDAHFDQLAELTKQIRRAQFEGDTVDHMASIHDWAFFVADHCQSPLLASFVRSLRLRGAPMMAMALNADMPEDDVFMQFTTQIMAEMSQAVRTRDSGRVRDLRRVDILTYQRYLYSRLGWSVPSPFGTS